MPALISREANFLDNLSQILGIVILVSSSAQQSPLSISEGRHSQSCSARSPNQVLD